jgi:hypothetical protein
VVGAAPVQAGDTLDVLTMKDEAVKKAKSAGAIENEADQLRLEGYVEQVAADRERQWARERQAKAAARFDMLDQNGGDIFAAEAMRPDLFADMTGEETARASQYAGDVSTGATRKTDWQAYNMLVNDPQLLVNTNLSSVRERFNARELGQLTQLQQSLIEDPGVEQNILTTSKMLGRMLEESGVEKNETTQAKFYSTLQEAIDQQLIASGKKNLTQREVKELAEDLLVEQVVSKGMIPLLDDEERAFEIEVPEAERAKIQVILEEQGLPVTDYNVLQVYRRSLPK